jgi:signal transduction histidine kinase
MLRAFLGDNREELIERCRLKSAKSRASRTTPEEPWQGVALFLSQFTEALAQGAPASGTQSPAAQAAAKHGQELLRHGYTIEQVVHDYGDLRQSIAELAIERAVTIPPDEFAKLNKGLGDAIACAVAAYSQQNAITVAVESRLAADERLRALASEMRNLINTSTLAISAMKRGSVGFGGATAAALDRSMTGMRGLIDRTLAELREHAGGAPHPEIIEIGPFIAAVQLVTCLEMANKGCDLTVVVEPDIFVEADRNVLSGAVTDLVRGALSTMPRDGHIFLSAHACDDRVIIDVEDSGATLGMGVLRDIVSRLEERASATTTLGSALLCSRTAVEASGGSLSVRTIAARGCLYTIDLPKRRAHG